MGVLDPTIDRTPRLTEVAGMSIGVLGRQQRNPGPSRRPRRSLSCDGV